MGFYWDYVQIWKLEESFWTLWPSNCWVVVDLQSHQNIMVILFNCGAKTVFTAPLSYYFIALFKIFIHLGEVCWACSVISAHTQAYTVTHIHNESSNKLSRTNRRQLPSSKAPQQHVMMRKVLCTNSTRFSQLVTLNLKWQTCNKTCQNCYIVILSHTSYIIFPKTELWFVSGGCFCNSKFCYNAQASVGTSPEVPRNQLLLIHLIHILRKGSKKRFPLHD